MLRNVGFSLVKFLLGQNGIWVLAAGMLTPLPLSIATWLTHISSTTDEPLTFIRFKTMPYRNLLSLTPIPRHHHHRKNFGPTTSHEKTTNAVQENLPRN